MAPVSVVIPCYRCSKTLGRAVASVASQTLRPAEIILVDDGNTDETVARMQELACDYGDWIRIIRLAVNGGVGAARNAGWEAAKYKYVAFLDADDSWLPAKIERQFRFMEAHPEFILTGHRWRYARDRASPSSPEAVNPDSHKVLNRLVLFRGQLVTPSIMVKRAAPNRFDPSRRYMEDQWFVQQYVLSGSKVARLDQILAVIHKAPFGEAGLSAQLWEMERGELRNYVELYRAHHIGGPSLIFFLGFSLLKFVRRVWLTALRKRGAWREQPAALPTAEGSTSPGQRVGVIIVNYNSGAMLRRCLEALGRQTFRDFSIIIVDNGSADGSIDDIAGFPGISIIRPGRNLGFAAANNLAAGHATDSEWLLLLNPDAFVEEHCLEHLVQTATTSPDFAMFQARLVNEADRSLLDGIGDVYHVSGLHWRQAHMRPATPQDDEPREIFSPCAAAAMYRREVFAAAGGFDEDFFCYAEDVDLGFRLRLSGHRALYVPGAVAYHVGSGTTGRRSDFSVYYGQRNLVWTYAKNMPASLLLLYALFHFAINIAMVAALAMRGQGMVALRAKIDAFRGLRKILKKRRAVQATRRVTVASLLSAMAKGWPSRQAESESV
jgi:GT2 family glycosyltransferase